MQHANKAWLSALLAGLTALLVSVQGNPELDTLGVTDWLIIVVAAVVSGLTVYLTPNRPT